MKPNTFHPPTDSVGKKNGIPAQDLLCQNSKPNLRPIASEIITKWKSYMKSKIWKESWSLFPTGEKFTEHRRIEWSKHFGSISRTIERVRRSKHKDWKKTTFDILYI